MTERATITLDEEAFAFLQAMAGNNRSAFINSLLLREKQRSLEEQIACANAEEAEDAAYQDALGEWDATLDDGLNA